MSYTQNIYFKMLLLMLMVFTQSYEIEDDIKTFTYNAAVVEYQPLENSTMTYEEKVNYTVHDYIRLLDEITEDLDVIAFPEATLMQMPFTMEIKQMTEVPEPFSENLCNSSNSKYRDFLKQLSCAAVRRQTTIVANLIEKENCTMNNVTGFCPSSGWIYYNCDVVFNWEGSVSAKYRKYNLFREFGLSPPSQVEVIHFTTKNNDTFGLFTCFDIIFKNPALTLPKIGIRNIVFPTMWFSELPYLTALQVQQMWAQENNVTFLSSGANRLRAGSGGSGIFVGSKGPVNNTIVGAEGSTVVLVHRVPRIELPNNPFINQITPMEEDIDSLAESLDDFSLIQDSSILSGHVSILLNISKTEVKEKVCIDNADQFCCQYHIKMKLEGTPPADRKMYSFHLAAFNGVRTFSGTRNCGIELCAVLACLNNSMSSCGKRFEKYADINWHVTFTYINVSAQFQISDDRIQFPNSLLASIRPITPQYTIWTKEELGQTVRRDHILNKTQTKLLTFGIYGRDFSRDNASKAEQLQYNYVTIVFLGALSVLVIVNRD